MIKTIIPDRNAAMLSPRAGTLRRAAIGFAMTGGLIGLAAFVGYVAHLDALVRVGANPHGMSPITSAGLMVAAATVLLEPAFRRGAMALAAMVAAAGAAMLIVHTTQGGDTLSAWIAARCWSTDPATTGRISVATAACLVLLGAATLLRARPLLADLAAAGALIASGVALLGYAYGVQDLYAFLPFQTMALNTAGGLFAVSASSLLMNPDRGWAAVAASGRAGGGSTRRQLLFLILPLVLGGVLARAITAHALGPAAALAALVAATIVPLALLIVRDGQLLNVLDQERRSKAVLQDEARSVLEARLASQALELDAQSDERAKAEAALFRAQRMEAVGLLTGGIAHDFNNLLMAVGGNLQLLGKRLPEDHPGRRYVANASTAVDSGAKLTAQLLAFSRTQKLEARPVLLDEALGRARELIGAALGPEIDVRMAPGAPGGWAFTDPDQLEHAILNLALNARDAMPGGGVLTITSGPCRQGLNFQGDEDDHLCVRVTDTGCGMSPEVAEQAVEPFFTTKERGKGTGLGLAQVYGFVRQCGGDLRIDSRLGRGSTIELRLRRAPAPASIPQASPGPAGLTSNAGAASRTLLVVDDDDSVRAVIVEALRASGYDVIEADSGAAGLAAIERQAPAAAIIDFIMPGMHGAEVARRAREIRPDLPVIFVSGYFDTAALDGISGAVIVRKPIDLEGLERTISSVMH